ncbi:IS1634 family transposase [Frankia sp. Cj5]|uniref:IS1634 family transposase n=1 Tax=Frankia sp. Cj5 TaxID=2880978 RepID=UPI001EF41F0C|nr:IS1634 family transposase [Frankia sp. Cj5]
MSLYGLYNHPEAGGEYATPRFGHPKDGRTDLRQVQAGLAVSADGGIPVLARAYDGGAAEISQVDEAMRAMRDLAGPRRFLLVGDRKLVSYRNLTAIDETGVRFVAPAPRSIVPPAVLATQDVATAAIVHYVPAREADLFAHQRDLHRVREGTVTLNGPTAADPPATYRAVFAHSARRAQASRTAREAAIEKARTDLARVHRTLGGRYYRDTDAVDTRVAKITAERKVGRWLRVHTDTDLDTGKPLLVWHFDAETLAVDENADGWFALLTNLTTDEADADEVLVTYKGQEAVERRYSALKGPLGIAPVFLQNPKRIHGLIHLLCLSLLVWALIEREARRAAGPSGKVPGLYARRPAVPTTLLIVRALAPMRLVPGRDGQPGYIPRPTPLQQRVLDLLGVDPTHPP